MAFGRHYPKNYEFRFRIGGTWNTVNRVDGNTQQSRAADDYFSVYDMSIQR